MYSRMYTSEIKDQAVHLRKRGYSLKEISAQLKISKSTASVWLSEVPLGKVAWRRLQQNRLLGQTKTIFIRKQRKEQVLQQYRHEALEDLQSIPGNRSLNRLFCSLMYWCEGAKEDKVVRFTNSDPRLVKAFLTLFRESFEIEESKFRLRLHLHEYHDESRQKAFWNAVTGIPASQFHKTYLKPHTGKNKRVDYPGCVCVIYYDARVARRLLTLAETHIKNIY